MEKMSAPGSFENEIDMAEYLPRNRKRLSVSSAVNHGVRSRRGNGVIFVVVLLAILLCHTAIKLLPPLQTSPSATLAATLSTAQAAPELHSETVATARPIATGSPSFFSVEPPDSLRRELMQCAAICSGSSLLDAQRLDDASVLESASPYESRMRQAYGTELPQELYPSDWPYAAYTTSQFALPAIIAFRLSQITTPPQPTTLDSADFLFINLDTFQLAHCCASCPHSADLPPEIDRHEIRRAVSRWILSLVRTHGTRRVHPSLVLALALIDHDYEGNVLRDDVESELRDKVVVVGIERAPWESEDRLKWFEGAPYPSAFHLKAEDGAKERVSEWVESRDRAYFVSFAGKDEPLSPKSGKGPHNGFAIRQALVRTLVARSPILHVHLFPPNSSHSPTVLASIHTAMSQSVFCLQPAGDSPTRKGFWESIQLGCIPVVFRPGTYDKVWPVAFPLEDGVLVGGPGYWDERVAVVVDEQSVIDGTEDVVRLLEAIEGSEVERRQREMSRIAHLVQFGLPGEKAADDAVDVLLGRLASIRDAGGAA